MWATVEGVRVLPFTPRLPLPPEGRGGLASPEGTDAAPLSLPARGVQRRSPRTPWPGRGHLRIFPVRSRLVPQSGVSSQSRREKWPVPGSPTSGEGSHRVEVCWGLSPRPGGSTGEPRVDAPFAGLVGSSGPWRITGLRAHPGVDRSLRWPSSQSLSPAEDRGQPRPCPSHGVGTFQGLPRGCHCTPGGSHPPRGAELMYLPSSRVTHSEGRQDRNVLHWA